MERHKRTKLEAKSKRCIFIGYQEGIKGYKLWDPTVRKVVINRNVTFEESKLVKSMGHEEPKGQESEKVESPLEIEVQIKEQPEQNPQVDEEDSEEGSEDGDEGQVQTQQDEQYSIATRRAQRIKKAPVRYGYEEDSVAFALVTEAGDPSTYQDALGDKDKSKWLLAMQEEMESLHKNHTWELVELPKKKRAIGRKWIYRKKETSLEDGGAKYKARLVAKVFSQKEGVDYNEIFSPIVKHTSIRILLSLVVTQMLELE